jgi:hypothetical protein
MQKRTSMMNGHFTMDSASGRGSRVRIQIPYLRINREGIKKPAFSKTRVLKKAGYSIDGT